MVSLKRAIAALIVCFRPHVFLTLCILLVIVHSTIVAVQKGTSNGWRVESRQHDITITMTTLILAVALIWAAFFIFIVRFELRNELDSLLVLFQCSKRGLRFLGVIVFHVGLLAFVGLLVSAVVERSIPTDRGRQVFNASIDHRIGASLEATQRARVAPVEANERFAGDLTGGGEMRLPSEDEWNSAAKRRPGERSQTEKATRHGPDRKYLLTIYKIWLTAIVYAFLYLIIENMIMFYADMTLVESVHGAFLTLVARLTGIDLSDFPAGEMLFNPLVHRIR